MIHFEAACSLPDQGRAIPLDRLTAFVFEGDEADELYVLGAWVTAGGDEAFAKCFLAVCARSASTLFWGVDDTPSYELPLSSELLRQGIRIGVEQDNDFRDYVMERFELHESATPSDAASDLIAALRI